MKYLLPLFLAGAAFAQGLPVVNGNSANGRPGQYQTPSTGGMLVWSNLPSSGTADSVRIATNLVNGGRFTNVVGVGTVTTPALQLLPAEGNEALKIIAESTGYAFTTYGLTNTIEFYQGRVGLNVYGILDNALGTLVAVTNRSGLGDMVWTGIGYGNGSGLTALNASSLTSGTVAEPRLHYAGTDPAAGLVLTSTSSNTPAWLSPGAATGDGTGWDTNGNSGLSAANVLGTLDNVNLKLVASNSVLANFSGYSNTIVMGNLNYISGWQPYSVIGGGRSNLITAPTNSAFHHLLGYNTISGGASNSITGTSVMGGNTIGGGIFNSILDDGANPSTIAGGQNGKIFGPNGVIGGGEDNDIGSSASVFASYGTIGGGFNNTIIGSGSPATNDYATVSGGRDNTSSGAYAVVPGGNQNTASGSNSIAMGFKASATHAGSVVISADVSATTGQASPAANSFTVNASGGINLLGGAITGNGSGLTNLNASSLASGTVPNARLTGVSHTNAPYISVTNLVIEGSGPGTIQFQDSAGGEAVTLSAPATLASNYSLAFPTTNGALGNVIKLGASGQLYFDTASASGFDPTVSNTYNGTFIGNGASLTNVWSMTPLYFYILGNNIAAGTKYAPIGASIGSYTLQASALTMTVPSPSGGYLSNLWVRSSVAWPATTNMSFTIQTNRGLTTPVDTLVTCTLDPQGGSSSTNSGTTAVALPIQSKTGDAYVMNLKIVVTAATGPLVTPTLSGYVEWWHQ